MSERPKSMTLDEALPCLREMAKEEHRSGEQDSLIALQHRVTNHLGISTHKQHDDEIVAIAAAGEWRAVMDAWQSMREACEETLRLLDGQTEPLRPISWQVELAKLRVALAKAKAVQP